VNCPAQQFRKGNGKEANNNNPASILGLAVLGSCFDLIAYLGEFVIAAERSAGMGMGQWSDGAYISCCLPLPWILGSLFHTSISSR
jgi:hypothetical protein